MTLHYIDGRPDGLLTAEMFDWAGHVLATPRVQITEALARPEAALVGVYILLGELNGAPRAYIGESDNIAARIKSHDANKEWWSMAVLVTAGAKLNKALARYLEGRLIEEATRVGRMELENGTSPGPQPLSEADRSNMEVFLYNLRMVLPAVRVDLFVERARLGKPTSLGKSATTKSKSFVPKPSGEVTGAASPEFILRHKKSGAAGLGRVVGGEFLILAGSTAHITPWIMAHETLGKLVNQLLRSGLLVQEGKLCRFVQSYAFGSPSTAGSLITGYSTNGQKDWKTASGQSYKEWEASRLAAS